MTELEMAISFVESWAQCRYAPTRKAAQIALAALREMQEREQNAPLSLEKLRGMDGEPVWAVSALGEQSMWYIVDAEDNELKNPWERITLEDWDAGWPYKVYRRPPEQ